MWAALEPSTVLAQARPVAVPETDGPPVLLDGTFSPGEWDDALPVPAGGGVTLFLKKEAGHLFIGVLCRGLTTPITDLFIEPDGGEVHQLHASAQLGEIILPPEGREPPAFVWGSSPFWYANEVRWDQARRERLMAEGMDADRAQMETIFPYDGFEFQIRQEKFDADQWRIRIEVPSHPDYENPLVFPENTRRTDSEGWLLLDLAGG
jgi:hypothetical protein